MSSKALNFFLALLLLAIGCLVYLYRADSIDAAAQIEGNGSGLLTDPNAQKIANFANDNGTTDNATMRQAVMNVHTARGINHDAADGFSAAARESGGVSLAIIKEAEVPAIMAEYRRLRAEQLATPPTPKREEQDEAAGVDEEESAVEQ